MSYGNFGVWGNCNTGSLEISMIPVHERHYEIIYKYEDKEYLQFIDNIWNGNLKANIKNKAIKFQIYLLKIKL